MVNIQKYDFTNIDMWKVIDIIHKAQQIVFVFTFKKSVIDHHYNLYNVMWVLENVQ